MKRFEVIQHHDYQLQKHTEQSINVHEKLECAIIIEYIHNSFVYL